jgi:putative phosphoribosyl transferase
LQHIADRAEQAARVLSDEIGAPATVPDIAGKTAILVDDGMATGATMRVAVAAVYNQGARQVTVALPVAPDTAVESLLEIADDVVILIAPAHLRAVGQWYQAFLDVPTQRVREVLLENPHRTPH